MVWLKLNRYDLNETITFTTTLNLETLNVDVYAHQSYHGRLRKAWDVTDLVNASRRIMMDKLRKKRVEQVLKYIDKEHILKFGKHHPSAGIVTIPYYEL